MKRGAATMAGLALAGCAGAERAERPASLRVAASTTAEPVVERCASRSMADFPGAYADPGNIVVGPLALVGAAAVEAATVREFGGDKLPVLLRPGHRATVALAAGAPAAVSLGFGPLPALVELEPRDGRRVITFVACPRGEPSGSTSSGRPVTFWMGFLLASARRCVPLDVSVDGAAPRRAVLRIGVRRCPASS